MKGKYTDLMFSDKLTLICRLFISRGHFCNFVQSPQSLSTAQVPDDEQFVPDFQSENCEYLKIYYLFSLTVYLEVVQRGLVIQIWRTKDARMMSGVDGVVYLIW